MDFVQFRKIHFKEQSRHTDNIIYNFDTSDQKRWKFPPFLLVLFLFCTFSSSFPPSLFFSVYKVQRHVLTTPNWKLTQVLYTFVNEQNPHRLLSTFIDLQFWVFSSCGLLYLLPGRKLIFLYPEASIADTGEGMFCITLVFQHILFLRWDRIKDSSKHFSTINQKFLSADKLLKIILPKASMETRWWGKVLRQIHFLVNSVKFLSQTSSRGQCWWPSSTVD